jgi:hypothetical protein
VNGPCEVSLWYYTTSTSASVLKISDGTTVLFSSTATPTQNTPYFNKLKYTGTAGTLYVYTTFSHYSIAKIAVTYPTTWNGTSWSDGAPTINKAAIITGAYSTTANGAIEAKTLTVDTGGSLVVNSGTSITVANELINNVGVNGIVFENNSKLMQNNNVTNFGNITLNRNATPMVLLDYSFWSSPVAAQNLFNFSPDTVTSRFYSFDTANNVYDNSTINNSSTFTAAKGYAVRAPNTFNATPAVFSGQFTGVPNNGNISIAVVNSSQGFNLVGNPYPSPIDADLFVTANSSLIDGTLYFYTHNIKSDGTQYESTALQYASWNKTGSTITANPSGTGSNTQNNSTPNGTIQVGQGFFVKASTAGNLSFTNAMRTVTGTAANADQFFKTVTTKSTAAPEKHRLWLNLSNANGVGLSQLLVGYVDGASNEVDNLYDGEEFGNPTTSLSSQLNGKSYTIQGRALPFVDSDVVPLAFKAATNGTYSISLAQTDGVFASDQEVLLKDNATGTLSNLKTGAYTFTATAGTANARFELVYSKSGINSIAENGVRATAVKKQGVFQISTNGAILKDIAVYDVQGHEVLKQKNINSSVSTLSDLPSTRGVFVVKLTTETNQTQTIKIIN